MTLALRQIRRYSPQWEVYYNDVLVSRLTYRYIAQPPYVLTEIDETGEDGEEKKFASHNDAMSHLYSKYLNKDYVAEIDEESLKRRKYLRAAPIPVWLRQAGMCYLLRNDCDATAEAIGELLEFFGITVDKLRLKEVERDLEVGIMHIDEALISKGIIDII